MWRGCECTQAASTHTLRDAKELRVHTRCEMCRSCECAHAARCEGAARRDTPTRCTHAESAERCREAQRVLRDVTRIEVG